ncbi:PadR family transcriptional regulator [Streptomyces sp. NPDC058471]|uniref:PadR family transcriptional regulator n=1 Tax=Streptomyces sp. NPDC058471 TaxID=3346516 RepID=UPI00365F4F4E
MAAPGPPSPQRPSSPRGPLPPTAWAVLGLLSFPGERTGYELKKWADASLRHFYWSPAISQIYAELRRLEALGYASSRRSGPEEPRAKRSYSITAEGRAALIGWAGGTQDAGPAVLKHPLLLRVWLGHLASPEHLRALVTEHIAHTRGELKEVHDALARADGEAAWTHPQIALRWSGRRLEAEIGLAEAMLADLTEMAAPTPVPPARTAAPAPAERTETDASALPGQPPGDSPTHG